MYLYNCNAYCKTLLMVLSCVASLLGSQYHMKRQGFQGFWIRWQPAKRLIPVEVFPSSPGLRVVEDTTAICDTNVFFFTLILQYLQFSPS